VRDIKANITYAKGGRSNVVAQYFKKRTLYIYSINNIINYQSYAIRCYQIPLDVTKI